MVTWLTTGNIDVDKASSLMINMFWHGLKGAPADLRVASRRVSCRDLRLLVIVGVLTGIVGSAPTLVLRFV